jgi:Protein of unknown function (DUF3277)
MSLANNDTKIYDATRYRIAFASVPISKGAGASGYAEGVFLELEQEGKDFDVKKGTDGTVTRFARNETVTRGTLHIMQTSESNDFLSTMLNLDKATPGGQGVASFVVEDLDGTTVFNSQEAWIEGPPKLTLDGEPTERGWPFCFTKVTRLDGSD